MIIQSKNTLLIIFFLILSVFSSYAQNITSCSGIVKDSITGEPLSYVSIIFRHTTIGAMSNDDGSFALHNNKKVTHIIFSSLGYNNKEITIPADKNTTGITVLMQPSSINIAEIVVKPKKQKYTKKNNPAVELIKKVIEHKNDNRVGAEDKYSVESYEKLALAFDDFHPNVDKGLMKHFKFIKNYLDTSKFNGKPILTVSIREKLSDIYYQKQPKKTKTIVKAQRMQGMDESLDEGGITSNLEEMFRHVNIFDNDIKILLNRFVSPLSSTLATSYYKYYIMDTVNVSNDKCIDLAFAPFNSESYAFTGHLYILLDGTYAIKKIAINTPYKINLNFVDKLRIIQEFEKGANDKWLLKQDNTYATFYIIKGSQQFYAHQLRNYSQYDFEVAKIDSVMNLTGPLHFTHEFDEKPDLYWTDNRPIPLDNKENALGDLLNEFRKVPAFNVMIKSAEILISGYIKTNTKKLNKFDFGPMNTTFSGNHLEGFRMRLGGMTTANLNPHLFATGFLAYGVNDRKFKYNTKLTYSINKKKYHEGEFPRNNISAIQEYDVYTPGQDFLTTSKDNIFLAFKVGDPLTKMTYNRKTMLQYEREWYNNLSVLTWFKNENVKAAGTLQYIERDINGGLHRIEDYTTSELGLQLRYAPGERIYNARGGKSSIFNLSKDAPILKLSHRVGFKDITGSDYNYQHTEVSAEKRIWLSSFGHIDTKISAGKIWDKVPFPLLIMPNSNQSLTIQPYMFHMMNAMEFISDQYVSFNATYYLKGWILNRVPLVKWFKLREILSFSSYWGSLSNKNNPSYTNGLYLFPEKMRPFGDVPYMEASVGLENIFKILRIDYFRRLNYNSNPETNRGGFRVALRFSF